MPKKIAVISGATSGIGRACVLKFASDGFRVTAIGRNRTELDALGALSQGHDVEIETLSADLSDIDQIDALATSIIAEHGQIDVLVNAAGILKNGTIETTSLEDWDQMLNINLRSVFAMIQKCLPGLEAVRGNVVNISSVTGTRSFPNVLAYCVAKAGLDQLTRCSALELAPRGVRVNAVNPGVVVTEIHKRGGMEGEAYDRFLEHSKTTHPLGRVGKPEEIAELVYYLASQNASWITGATYEIDGGRALTCAR